MGFKDKLAQSYADNFFKKYGDRIVYLRGQVISIQITTKRILWIFYKLYVEIIMKPEGSKMPLKSFYKKNKFFKAPSFIKISKGNLIYLTGLKGKKGEKNSTTVKVMNIYNQNTDKELVETGQKPKVVNKLNKLR
ncbi:MAG: hypothetical protein FWC47_04410 [Oscillospiraceae bacterium]|nr:hypothetical protein [Oscillospiraceae bacterium]